ncbi:hypothetical protein CRG98_005999 [Punica granatum]|uniref:Uncharacterized protein n=1 Tax=Punica granatum TaxID=22663 RepID=A0A2I0KYS7_PUNGR|nr:hypothetical protein CRG98_005999 [Punica granatum]
MGSILFIISLTASGINSAWPSSPVVETPSSTMTRTTTRLKYKMEHVTAELLFPLKFRLKSARLGFGIGSHIYSETLNLPRPSYLLSFQPLIVCCLLCLIVARVEKKKVLVR